MASVKNFVTIGRDMDTRSFQRTFSGRITRKRWEILRRFARNFSAPIKRCHHEHDCCGCLHSQSMTVDYKYNQVVLTATQSFNY